MISIIVGLTLVVPKTHLNHRLAYTNRPIIINSAVYKILNKNSLFNFSDQFTRLVSSGKSICNKSDGALEACSNTSNPITWKIITSRQEVQFKDAYGDCLTVGKYNHEDDSFEVKKERCVSYNMNQIFVLDHDHDKKHIRKMLI